MLTRTIATLLLLFTAIRVNASTTDIHKMMVGSKVLEVIQNRQLTFREDGDIQSITVSPNGKYAVYLTVQPNIDSNNRIARFYLIKLSTGKLTLLMEGCLPDNNYPDNYQWKLYGGDEWSPDSRFIALYAGLKIDDHMETSTNNDSQEKQRERRGALLFFDTTGNMVSTYYPPEGNYLFPYEWNPDSHRIAIMYYGKSDEETGEQNNTVVVYDVINKLTQTLFTKTCRHIRFERWIEDGNGVLYSEFLGEGIWLFHKRYLDGRPPAEYEESYDKYRHEKKFRIPFNVESTEDGAVVEDIEKGQMLCTIKGLKQYDIHYLPGTRFLEYQTKQIIQNEPDGQQNQLDSIWLIYPEGKKQNRICVALNEEITNNSWSENCLAIIYVSQNRAFLTELSLRNPTPREKATAGIQLTEEETKALLLENAHQIVDAIENSVSNSEYYPSQENFVDRIKHHLRDADALLIPGTDKIGVTYFKPNDKYHIGNQPPPDTLLAVLDSGYGWQLNIFADGHVQEALK